METSGALAADLAFLQQSGIFPSTQDPSAALAPTAPPTRAMMTARLKARFSIPSKLYLARRTAVKQGVYMMIFETIMALRFSLTVGAYSNRQPETILAPPPRSASTIHRGFLILVNQVTHLPLRLPVGGTTRISAPSCFQ